MSKTFQEEQNELLQFNINNKFYDRWIQKQKYNKKDILETPCVEFIITPVCNKQCEYCYLVKYGDELYPKKFRDQDTIFHNLKLMLTYFKENHFHIPKFDFFSGEIWHTDFGIKLLISLLAEIKSGLEIEMVMIPSNFTFIKYDDKVKQIETLIDEYSKAGSMLCFSASVDGKYSENKTRPFKDNNIPDDEYWDKLFKFCKKHEFGFHPMMSAYDIENYKQNYTWFMEKIKDYGFLDNSNFACDIYKYIMFLEVRNNDWTEDKLEKYIDALNYSCEYDIENIWSKDQNGIEYLISRMLGNTYTVPEQYRDLFMNYTNYFGGRNPGLPVCTISYTLMIRAGDLAIVPCHRTSYDKFIYGYFKKENDKITGIEAQNPILANRIWNQKMKASPFCDRCSLYNYCMRGCYGSQYEINGDLFYPNTTCCDLFKIKAMFLYFKTKSLIKRYNLDEKKFSNLEFDSIIKCIEEEDKEKFNKWHKTIQNKISQNYMKIQL